MCTIFEPHSPSMQTHVVPENFKSSPNILPSMVSTSFCTNLNAVSNAASCCPVVMSCMHSAEAMKYGSATMTCEATVSPASPWPSATTYIHKPLPKYDTLKASWPIVLSPAPFMPFELSTAIPFSLNILIPLMSIFGSISKFLSVSGFSMVGGNLPEIRNLPDEAEKMLLDPGPTLSRWRHSTRFFFAFGCSLGGKTFFAATAPASPTTSLDTDFFIFSRRLFFSHPRCASAPRAAVK
mmetsp:Transcript_84440/g.131904  ORF Transcript_84440/g.131904 Transcript_84440/m.131904 type:complete len:238 (-) Transcript_84440:29-742(-)